MKVSDLMVGDWVICNHYQDKPFTKQFGVADFAKGEYEFDEPIPLTEEILVKNGFHTYGESYFIPEDKCNAHVRIGFHKRETVVDLHRHGAFSIQISCKPGKLYVHQLQHLLRLAGVQKEIEL